MGNRSLSSPAPVTGLNESTNCMLWPPKVEQDFWTSIQDGADPQTIADDAFRAGVRRRIPVWVFALCSLYMAVMLGLDARKKPCRRRNKRCSKTLKVSRFVAASVTSATLSYTGVSVLIEASDVVDCNWFQKAENALYWVDISVIYTVLWLRQKVILGQPTLKHLTSKFTSFLSNTTIVLVFALPIVNSLLFSTRLMFCHHPFLKICVMIDVLKWFKQWPGEFIVPILLPATLLVLLAWPLLQHHRQSSVGARGRTSVMITLRRIFVVTLFCLFTDIVAISCNGLCNPTFSVITRQLSLFSNLVCMVVSFADWRRVLFPRKRSREQNCAEIAPSLSIFEHSPPSPDGVAYLSCSTNKVRLENGDVASCLSTSQSDDSRLPR